MGRSEVQRIGVLTGGGDCPGLNAVIRAVVGTAIRAYGWEVIGIPDGFEGLLFPERTYPITLADIRGILHRGGTILGSTNRSNPFRISVDRDGQSSVEDHSAHVVTHARELGLDCVITIGGDGTLSIARDLAAIGLPVVGVPKTIDNDVSATDFTFGFDTALHVATDAIDRLHTTAESHGRVMLLEVMGRDAGWIALHAGLAGGADVILIPEIPFTLDGIRAAIERRDRAGRHFSIVVVAEGAALPPGAQERRSFGSVGMRLAGALDCTIPHEVRCTVLGHIQRGGSPSPFDRVLGTRYGSAAVRLAAERGFGRMVALRGNDMTSATLDDAVGIQKRVDPNGELTQVARGLGISFGE